MGKEGVTRNLPNNAYQAATGANNPDGTNVYATLADLFQQDGLIDGSAVWSGSGFIYDVTNLLYRIGGVLYTSTATQVTLTAADPGLDRKDRIVVNTAGVVSVKTGVPAPAPVAPALDVDEVLVAEVFVGAGTTAPVITIEALYDENAGSPTEWIGTSDDGNVTFASAADPNTGTVSIETTLPLGSNKHIQLAKGSPYTIVSGSVDFYIKAKQAMSTPSGQLYIGFYVGGSLVGNSVYIGGSPTNIYGFDPTNTSTYQLVSIPITAFGVLPTTVDAIRFFKGPGSTTAEFFLDGVEIQEGAVAPPVAPSLPSLTEFYDWVGDATNNAVERRNSLEPFPTGSSPTVNDDETLGYRRGSMVFDFSGSPALLWICTAATAGNAQWKIVNNDVINFWGAISLAADAGFTWGSGTLNPLSYGDGLQLVAGTNVTIETDTLQDAVRISATGGVDGSGTLNYIPKWTPDGTTLGDSPLQVGGAGFNLGHGGNPLGLTMYYINSAPLVGLAGLQTGIDTRMTIPTAVTNRGIKADCNNAIARNTGFEAIVGTGASTPVNVGADFAAGSAGSCPIPGNDNDAVGFRVIGMLADADGNNLGPALGAYLCNIQSNAFDNVGLMVNVANAGAGGAYIGLLKDGNEGAGKVLTSDANGYASWQTPAGGPGGGGWQPPHMTLSSWWDSTAARLANANAGFQISFSPSANQDMRCQVSLDKNGVAYDGSNLRLRLHWQLFNSAPGVGDDVLWRVSYVFLLDGDDGDSKAATTVDNVILVESRTQNQLYTDDLNIMTGVANARTLAITLTRQSSGAPPVDSYSDFADVFGAEIIKA